MQTEPPVGEPLKHHSGDFTQCHRELRPNLLPMFLTRATSRWLACRQSLNRWRPVKFSLSSHRRRELCMLKCPLAVTGSHSPKKVTVPNGWSARLEVAIPHSNSGC